jgi:hypothetical protein
MLPTVVAIAPASATEGSPAVFELHLSNPSAIHVYLTQMELLEVLITLPQTWSNCTCGCYYGNFHVPTTDLLTNQ